MHGGRNELVNRITNLLDGIVFEEPRYVDIAANQNDPLDSVVTQPALQRLTLMHIGAPII